MNHIILKSILFKLILITPVQINLRVTCSRLLDTYNFPDNKRTVHKFLDGKLMESHRETVNMVIKFWMHLQSKKDFSIIQSFPNIY